MYNAGSKFQAKSDENSENTDKGGVMSGRDLNDSLEKEWDGSKNDPDLDILYGDLGDITFFDASTSKEHLNRTGIHTNKHTLQCFLLHYFLVAFLNFHGGFLCRFQHGFSFR